MMNEKVPDSLLPLLAYRAQLLKRLAAEPLNAQELVHLAVMAGAQIANELQSIYNQQQKGQ